MGMTPVQVVVCNPSTLSEVVPWQLEQRVVVANCLVDVGVSSKGFFCSYLCRPGCWCFALLRTGVPRCWGLLECCTSALWLLWDPNLNWCHVSLLPNVCFYWRSFFFTAHKVCFMDLCNFSTFHKELENLFLRWNSAIWLAKYFGHINEGICCPFPVLKTLWLALRLTASLKRECSSRQRTDAFTRNNVDPVSDNKDEWRSPAYLMVDSTFFFSREFHNVRVPSTRKQIGLWQPGH